MSGWVMCSSATSWATASATADRRAAIARSIRVVVAPLDVVGSEFLDRIELGVLLHELDGRFGQFHPLHVGDLDREPQRFFLIGIGMVGGESRIRHPGSAATSSSSSSGTIEPEPSV